MVGKLTKVLLAQSLPAESGFFMIRTKNKCELKALKHLEDQGYEVIKNGWPDFIAINNERKIVRFIEVKPSTKKLKPRQIKVKNIFTFLGLKYETLFVDNDRIYYDTDQTGKL